MPSNIQLTQQHIIINNDATQHLPSLSIFNPEPPYQLFETNDSTDPKYIATVVNLYNNIVSYINMKSENSRKLYKILESIVEKIDHIIKTNKNFDNEQLLHFKQPEAQPFVIVKDVEVLNESTIPIFDIGTLEIPIRYVTDKNSLVKEVLELRKSMIDYVKNNPLQIQTLQAYIEDCNKWLIQNYPEYDLTTAEPTPTCLCEICVEDWN